MIGKPRRSRTVWGGRRNGSPGGRRTRRRFNFLTSAGRKNHCSRTGSWLRRSENELSRRFRQSCPGRQGEAFRSVQARRAAVTSDSPAPAPPIPHMVGVLRSASACCDSLKRSGLTRAAASNSPGARPQGRVHLALPARIGLSVVAVLLGPSGLCYIGSTVSIS